MILQIVWQKLLINKGWNIAPTTINLIAWPSRLYAYDALGRRLEKKVVYPDNSSKDFIRRFMYDGSEIVTEVDGTNQVLANYTHSNLRTDDVLSVQITTEGKTQGLAKSQGNYFYLKDSLGTITDITDGSGNLIQHFVYSPFGEIIKVTNKLNEDISSDWMIRTSYTFTNREYDEESGLYYYRARYYDASTGRFLQVDPDPGKLSMPSTHVNKYIYVGNNPFNLTDPSGESIFKKLGKWGSVAVGGFLFGPLGQWAAVNFSGQFSERDIKIVNTAVILAGFVGLGIIAGPAIAAGATSNATAIAAGSALIQSSFQDGNFIKNFAINFGVNLLLTPIFTPSAGDIIGESIAGAGFGAFLGVTNIRPFQMLYNSRESIQLRERTYLPKGKLCKQ